MAETDPSFDVDGWDATVKVRAVATVLTLASARECGCGLSTQALRHRARGHPRAEHGAGAVGAHDTCARAPSPARIRATSSPNSRPAPDRPDGITQVCTPRLAGTRLSHGGGFREGAASAGAARMRDGRLRNWLARFHLPDPLGKSPRGYSAQSRLQGAPTFQQVRHLPWERIAAAIPAPAPSRNRAYKALPRFKRPAIHRGSGLQPRSRDCQRPFLCQRLVT